MNRLFLPLTMAVMALSGTITAYAAQPKVVAHRGYWNTEGSAQNSIRALVKADSIGCDASEFDVWLTADNKLVVNHNADINGKNIENGKSKQLLKEKLPNGETLPTLDQFLEAAKSLKIDLVLEVKPHADQQREDIAVPMIIDMVRDKGLTDRTTYITFSRHAFDLLVEQSGRPVYFLTGMEPDELKAAGGTGPDFHMNVFRKNPDWIHRFKQLGMPINIWTIAKDADMQYCIDHEVDFITTDIPERAIEMIAESTAPRDLTVMTFNLHAGSDAPIDSIAKIINDANPDFVALEELDAFTRRGNAPLHNGRNMIADLAAATGMFPLYGRTLNFAGGYYGIGLLSKHPCIKSEVMELPNPKNHEPRALVEGTFELDGKGKVIFASTHLCVEDSTTRALQAKYIASRYADSEYPVIIGGDFNSLPVSEAIVNLEAEFGNISGTAPTFPSGTPEKKLDYLFATSPYAIELISTEVIDNLSWASDHRPVTSKILLYRK